MLSRAQFLLFENKFLEQLEAGDDLGAITTLRVRLAPQQQASGSPPFFPHRLW